MSRNHHVGAAARSARSVAADTDSVEQRQKLGIIPGLTGGEQDPQRPPAAVDSEVDLGAQPAAGSAEVLSFDSEGFNA